MTPKCKSSDSRDLDRPEGSHKASPLNEKVKVLDLIRKGKKKSGAEFAKIYSKTESFIRELEEGERNPC